MTGSMTPEKGNGNAKRQQDPGERAEFLVAPSIGSEGMTIMKWVSLILTRVCAAAICLAGISPQVAAQAQESTATSQPDSTAAAQAPSIPEGNPNTIPAGVQGSINPLRDVSHVLTGDDLLDQSFPSSIPLFGTNIRLGIDGYIKADFIRDFDYVGDPFEFELGSIAVDGSPNRALGGTTTFHAKESRISFDLRSKAKRASGKEFPMRVFVEYDWFFDSPSQALNTRLRHAYGVLGRLLIGRTWTTSGDLTALAGTIDFSGGDALYGGRATQIRWQDKLGKSFQYALAVEEISAQIGNPDDLEGASRPPAPNLAGMIKWKSTEGSSIQLGADVFPVNWSGPSTVPNETKVGYAITVMSRLVLDVSEYRDALVWGAGFGEGQGGKIIALSWDGKATGVLTPAGLDLAPAWFAYAGYSHYWNKSLNSTVSTNWAGTDLSSYQTDDTIQKAGSVHANLIWFPYKLISTGIEYMWGMREDKNGIQGTASRVQAMAKFKFN